MFLGHIALSLFPFLALQTQALEVGIVVFPTLAALVSEAFFVV